MFFVAPVRSQERFRTLSSSYFRGMHALMVLYSVCDRTSFTQAREWLHNIDRYAIEGIPVILVGNKCEIAEDCKREVSYEQGQQLIDEITGGIGHRMGTDGGEGDGSEARAAFIEINSAKEDVNISEAFEYLVARACDRRARSAAGGHTGRCRLRLGGCRKRGRGGGTGAGGAAPHRLGSRWWPSCTPWC